LLALLLFTGLVFAHSSEKGDLQVRHPWSRATPPGAEVGAGYMEIRNNGRQPDRLVAASSPIAKRVEMHISEREGEVLKMRQVKSFEIPARERYELRPGGSHLMLVEITRPLQKGERIPLTLRFEHAGELEVQLEVQEMGSSHSRH
jgi:copper(I)-binding protein